MTDIHICMLKIETFMSLLIISYARCDNLPRLLLDAVILSVFIWQPLLDIR